MSLLRWKFWQWTAVGILIGLLLAYLHADPDFTPHNISLRVSAADFNAALADVAIDATHPRVSHIVVYPSRENIQLVTFDDFDGTTATPHFFYAKNTDMAQQFTQHGVPFKYAWWTLPAWNFAMWFGGATLAIGIVWPMLLRLMLGAGLGPKNLEPAYDLDRFDKTPEAVKKKVEVTERDRKHLAELEAEMEAGLTKSSSAAASAVSTQSPQTAVQTLNAGPLEKSAEQKAEEDKHYKGEFYPVSRPTDHHKQGFSIVELLVVIGIISLLLALLLPALQKARETANQITCASNLHNIGVGFAAYLVENGNTFPPAYLYVGQTIQDGQEVPTSPVNGYQHWSYYLYGNGKMPAAAFQCPSLDRGGLPPSDTTTDNLDPGQINASDGIVDQQVPRLAYTVNEAICPRNKFVQPFQSAQRVYKYVKTSQITNSTGTILATEFTNNAARAGGSGGGYYIWSHRPVHGYIGNDGTLDMFLIAQGAGFRRITADDLDPDPSTSDGSGTRLDWVGRNHGTRQNYPDRRRTNFLYVDGHVETKTIYETLSPFQWGEKFWSLSPNDDMQSP